MDGAKKPTYVDDHLGMRGVVDIRLGADPEYVSSHILTFDGMLGLTEVVDNLTNVHENHSRHTVVMKFESGDTPGYTGLMTIQATMDNIMQQTTNVTFFDVAEFDYVNQIENVTLNFTGVFSGVRFLQSDTDGLITELQYRF